MRANRSIQLRTEAREERRVVAKGQAGQEPVVVLRARGCGQRDPVVRAQRHIPLLAGIDCSEWAGVARRCRTGMTCIKGRE